MTDRYENPLISRYASREMSRLFSDDKKFRTWRTLWVALAQAEMELGLPITPQQVEQLRTHIDDIDYDTAKKREAEVRHDVMAHVYAYGKQCPDAQAIIHLGATSCYVGDNADILIMREALGLIKARLVACMRGLSAFAAQYRALPTLGFTHFQPAQLTTVGKRACLWLQDLLLDYRDLEYLLSHMKLRGVKGTTGTQASFLTLFEGDHEKVRALEAHVCELMGMDAAYAVTGQTYPRKLDSQVMNVLSGIAQSAHKFSEDIRLLQHLKEIEEPFESEQIGSSAMAYKRNPMRSERIGALSRYVIVGALNPDITAATQWFERTLDDSANKRLSMAQAFLAVDGILRLYQNVSSGLVVYPRMIDRHIQAELPFMATENILMEAVKRGGDRQELHERIRRHSMDAGRRVKEEGLDNDLIERLRRDDAFPLTAAELDELLDARNFIGRAAEQVDEFLTEMIAPVLGDQQGDAGPEADIRV